MTNPDSDEAGSGVETAESVASDREALAMSRRVGERLAATIQRFKRSEECLTILANSDVSRGKYAAAAVHAALYHYGIEHGAVIVLGARPGQIEEQCDVVIHDAGRTEVEPGTVTAGVRRD